MLTVFGSARDRFILSSSDFYKPNFRILILANASLESSNPKKGGGGELGCCEILVFLPLSQSD